MLCGSLDGRGVWGRTDPCIRMTESLHCSPETISYTPIQNEKFKVKKKKYEFCFSAELSEMIADMIIVPKRFLIADLSIPIYMKGNLVGWFLKCVYALTECCLLRFLFPKKV